MKKTTVLSVMFGLLVVIAASAALAQEMGTQNGPYYTMGFMHEQMEQIMEEGSYTELNKLREESGIVMMPWVTSQDDFDVMKEHHELMEKYHEENRLQRDKFRVNSFQQRGGCHR